MAVQILLTLTVVVLVVAACLTLWRLARGPSGLDRGVASDVLVAIVIGAISTYAVAMRSSLALIVILVLSLVGFTGAVGLARLITGASVRERRFMEAEARAAYRDHVSAQGRPDQQERGERR